MTMLARRTQHEDGTFAVTPLCPATEPDFEAWASAWCARRGWALVEVESQRRCAPEWFQLELRARREP